MIKHNKIPLSKNRSYSTMKSNTIMNTLKSLFVALLCMMWTQTADAQIPAAPQSGPIALVGGTIHTVSGDVIENGTLLFEEGVITAIGTDVELPEGTAIEDVTGKMIYPGLIDSYSQMGIYEIGAVSLTVDVNEQGPINPNVKVERAFNPESRHIGIARSAGVLTSVTTPGGGLISGQSAAMHMDGWAWDTMTLKSGVGMIVSWPSANSDNYKSNIEDIRKAFADARAYKKAREASGVPRHDIDTRWESMIPVFTGEMPVIVDADDVRQIQDAITWAEEEDVRMILLSGRDSYLVTEYLKKNDIPVIITNVITAPNRAWESYDARYSLPSKLYDAGVEFAIAGDASAANANRLPLEAGAAAGFGLPVDEAIKAITLSPAKILGLDDRIGALEVGLDATFLITDGNPIEYATQVEQVYIRGSKSDMNDMHRQFYKKYREKLDQAR
tara:strand:+ start:66358 stop:67689 length:1332 start_codon:yes stop_codon:yes gene_type:complete